eukprot:763614-Hanusia_phi.AAC.2
MVQRLDKDGCLTHSEVLAVTDGIRPAGCSAGSPLDDDAAKNAFNSGYLRLRAPALSVARRCGPQAAPTSETPLLLGVLSLLQSTHSDKPLVKAAGPKGCHGARVVFA